MTAAPRARLALPRRGRRGIVPFAIVAALLHGAVLWLLLPHGAAQLGAQPAPEFTVELVDQAPKVKGAAMPPMPVPSA